MTAPLGMRLPDFDNTMRPEIVPTGQQNHFRKLIETIPNR